MRKNENYFKILVYIFHKLTFSQNSLFTFHFSLLVSVFAAFAHREIHLHHECSI